MRVGLGLVAASMLSLAPGCAHFSTGDDPMTTIETTASSSPPPPPLVPAPRERWTRRKTWLTSGITVGAVGATLMIGGGIGYGVAALHPHPGEAACRSCVPPIDTTATDASIYTVAAGAALLATGVALMLVGFTRHD